MQGEKTGGQGHYSHIMSEVTNNNYLEDLNLVGIEINFFIKSMIKN